MASKGGPTFSFKGGKELEQNLLDLAKEFGPRNIRSSMNAPLKKAIVPITEEIRQKTPVDTGKLKASIITKTGRGPIVKAIKTLGRKFGYKAPKTNVFAAAYTGWTGPWYKLFRVEYGTRHFPAKHIISQSLENKGQEALNILSSQWNSGLAKTVKRLNKRKALGKLKIK